MSGYEDEWIYDEPAMTFEAQQAIESARVALHQGVQMQAAQAEFESRRNLLADAFSSATASDPVVRATQEVVGKILVSQIEAGALPQTADEATERVTRAKHSALQAHYIEQDITAQAAQDAQGRAWGRKATLFCSVGEDSRPRTAGEVAAAEQAFYNARVGQLGDARIKALDQDAELRRSQLVPKTQEQLNLEAGIKIATHVAADERFSGMVENAKLPPDGRRLHFGGKGQATARSDSDAFLEASRRAEQNATFGPVRTGAGTTR